MSRQVKFRQFFCLDFECCKKVQLFKAGGNPPPAGLYVACFYLAIAVKNLNKYFNMNMAWLRASHQFPHRMRSPRDDSEDKITTTWMLSYDRVALLHRGSPMQNDKVVWSHAAAYRL
jgi:hypothetical protein